MNSNNCINIFLNVGFSSCSKRKNVQFENELSFFQLYFYLKLHCPKSREQFLSHERDVTIKTTTGKKQFPSFCTLPRKKLFLHVPTLPCHERNISLSSNHPLKSVHSAGIKPRQSGCQLRMLALSHRTDDTCYQNKESNKDFALS